jgi:glyoxylase-like metal-dependent hydrolase (beta-lactamase superfamily II)
MGRVDVTDLGGGVHRVTLPLPWTLDHVHAYALEDPDGWTLVDAGLATPEAAAEWTEALARLGRPRVRRIVVTHYHRDHVEGAAGLVALVGAEEVVQGAEDAESARRLLAQEYEYDGFFVAHGMPHELATEGWRAPKVEFAEPTRTVSEGDVLEIAGERFRVLVLPGHADGHIALLGERSGRLVGGDVILHDITPNVGPTPDGRPDSLGDYLATLDRLAQLAPRIVYPGHRRVIEDVPRRAAEIRDHHAVRLDEFERALRAGATTTYELSRSIWGDLGPHERRFAVGEAFAHLVRLERLGRAKEVATGRWRLPA